ncbi:MAG: hypothetical protein IJ563_09110 [Selenomonadaceae bacterium]|nr:hypothetical protein [Selenomonadaceae bacterium]
MRRIKKLMAATVLAFTTASFSPAEANDLVLGTFFTSDNDTTMQCYLSRDGINMKHWATVGAIMGRDISCQYYNGFFYICLVEPPDSENTFRIYKMEAANPSNLTPMTYKVIDRGDKNRNIWAPDLFIDEGGKAYVYFAKQRHHKSKNNERQFDIYVATTDNIEDENVGFKPNATKIDVPEQYENVIDAQVRKINGTYYMILKNETYTTSNDNKSPILLRSNSPTSDFVEVTDWPLKYIRGYEGFSILERGGKVYIYADNFSHKYDKVSTSNYTVWYTDVNNIETGPYKSRYVESDNPMRHGSLLLLDETTQAALNLDSIFLSQLVNENIDNSSTQVSTQGDTVKEIKLTKEDYGNGEKGSTVTIDYFAPAPNVVYIVPRKTNVVINNIYNPYGVTEFSVILQDEASFKIIDEKREQNPDNGDEKFTFKININGNIQDVLDADGNSVKTSKPL